MVRSGRETNRSNERRLLTFGAGAAGLLVGAIGRRRIRERVVAELQEGERRGRRTPSPPLRLRRSGGGDCLGEAEGDPRVYRPLTSLQPARARLLRGRTGSVRLDRLLLADEVGIGSLTATRRPGRGPRSAPWVGHGLSRQQRRGGRCRTFCRGCDLHRRREGREQDADTD